MRPIIFRAKRTGNGVNAGKWVHGSLIHSLNGVFMYGYQARCQVPVDPATIGQFTGLHDKNGKEIYEGDIIKIVEKFDDENVYTSNGVVCFEEGIYEVQNGKHFAYLGWLMHNDDITKLEVIGNIHDNPELINKRTND